MEYFRAIYSNRPEEVEQLLNSGYDTNSRDTKGNTPLITAAGRAATVAIANLLIEAGADVNATNHDGWTALHSAAQSRLLQIAQLLVAHGALIDVQDKFGNSPLLVAVMNAKLGGGVVEFLISKGANPYLENRIGVSPISLARTISNFDALQCFR